MLCLWLGAMAAPGCSGKAAPAAGAAMESPVDRAERRPTVATAAPVLPDLRGVLFVDVARERGLHYVWPEQPRPMRALEAFGSGCAAFDGDNDGWQDVLLVGDPCPALFRNIDGARFENVTPESGLTASAGNWKGCAIGDYDGDGLLDVLLTG
ncbi:MAG: FG-GAP repeat domain-containing protein, partial [Deltaproteobacteria bacterium]